MAAGALDLVLNVLKYCFYVTLVRLASTAFGWEFGLSRQYLRLLEWLFRWGEKRIERAESRHRQLGRADADEGADANTAAAGTPSAGAAQAHERPGDRLAGARPAGGRQKNVANQAAAATGSMGSGSDLSGAAAACRQRPVPKAPQPSGFGGDDDDGPQQSGPPTAGCRDELKLKLELELALSRGRGQPAAHQAPAKLRRISTPEGPPVFLLDDFSDEDEDEDGDEGEGEGANENANANESEQAHARRWESSERARRNNINNASPNHHHQPAKHEFQLHDACQLVARALSAIVDDQVTKRFSQEELKTWNLLSRTNARNYHFMSRTLGLSWLAGFLVRYALLMPLRIMFTLTGFAWLIGSMALVGLLPARARDKPYRLFSLMSFRMLSCGITSRLKFHNRQNRAQAGDICVANHTSPLDVVLLACDNCYALVGQRHAGLLGLLEDALSRATNHVWFDRAEMRDRQLVTQRLREHSRNKNNLPVLIFPEGTCINNSAVMMFRKGTFETTDRVLPIAIKYDARFGDPFWNSGKQSYVHYLLLMMSSWAIKCEVWYLEPMHRLAGECSAEFANRVKARIAKQAGLIDLNWDGQLKRTEAKAVWRQQQQEDYARRLKLE